MTILLQDGIVANTACIGHINGTIYIIEDSDSAIAYLPAPSSCQ